LNVARTGLALKVSRAFCGEREKRCLVLMTDMNRVAPMRLKEIGVATGRIPSDEVNMR